MPFAAFMDLSSSSGNILDNYPSSGYGTMIHSPDDSTPTGQPQQPETLSPSTPWIIDQTKDMEYACCSLLGPVWSNSSLDDHQLDHNRSRNIGAAATPVCTSRDYSSPDVKRGIVTIDVEEIELEDQRHHPLDRTTERSFLRKPWGMATNSRTEQIYIADRLYHVILVFGPDGEYIRKFGGLGSQPGLFNRPCGLAYDATKDRLLVVDKENHRVQIFCATTGQFLFAFGSLGTQPGQFSHPWGITVSPDGSLIAVTDARNRRVQLFSSEGSFQGLHYITQTIPCKDRIINSYPSGIVFDKTGRCLFVTDFNLHQIFRLDIAFGQLDRIMIMERPSGIDVDHHGNLLVCDTRNHLIRIYGPEGQPLGNVQKIGRYLLDHPVNITIMASGHIAVLEHNGRVHVF